MAVADLFNPVPARQSPRPSGRRLFADGGNAERVSRPTLPPITDRWSLRVELKDDEIARLYAQGLTRGALVWREGMPEWRPLLITPELSRLLHSTPITLRDVTDFGPDDEVTLPRPARLPTFGARAAGSDDTEVPTVAPTALDITAAAPAPSTPRWRRYVELGAVATLGFGAAWFARGDDAPPVAASSTPVTAVAATPAPAPLPPPPGVPSLLASGGSIPIVALTDLPLLGPRARAGLSFASHSTPARARATRAPSSSGDGPTRAQLLGALNQVASVASGCGERGGPVRVVIAFAPSGVARSIQVSGKELPASVRSCIVGAASRARVGRFSGDPVTVSKTL